MDNMCCTLSCLGVLIVIGLLIWVLVKQHQCCDKKKEGYHREYDGVASSVWTKYH